MNLIEAKSTKVERSYLSSISSTFLGKLIEAEYPLIQKYVASISCMDFPKTELKKHETKFMDELIYKRIEHPTKQPIILQNFYNVGPISNLKHP